MAFSGGFLAPLGLTGRLALSGAPFANVVRRGGSFFGLRAGGFGLMICKGMVDELRYNDRGNEVTLIKMFAQKAPE